MKKTKTFNLSPTLRHQIERLPLNMSAAVSQAILNAYDDDTLLVKALKRRLALPPEVEEASERMNVSQDVRVEGYLEELAAKSQLTKEMVRRLAIEAYIHKL